MLHKRSTPNGVKRSRHYVVRTPTSHQVSTNLFYGRVGLSVFSLLSFSAKIKPKRLLSFVCVSLKMYAGSFHYTSSVFFPSK